MGSRGRTEGRIYRRHTLSLDRDREAHFAPTIVMRRAGRVFQQRAPKCNTLVRGDRSSQYHAEGSLCGQRSSCRKALCRAKKGKGRSVLGGGIFPLCVESSMRRSTHASYLSIQPKRAKVKVTHPRPVSTNTWHRSRVHLSCIHIAA